MSALGLARAQSVALGLSGGGDSVALALLVAAWSTSPAALIVDHGLRKTSRKEAEQTAAWARELGLGVTVLRWCGKKPGANVEDEARAARYRLMGAWCRAHGIRHLLVAHTRDDQAETFLLRLGRGSGIDGLAAMSADSPFPLPGYGELRVVRPLLGLGRAELRGYAKRRGATWLEDPMNADVRFARTRVRRIIPLLEEAGVPVARIVQAAEHAARARQALQLATEEFLAAHARFDGAEARIDPAALRKLPREIGLRALAAVLGRVSGQGYRPRFERLERLFDALTKAKGRFPGATLHGCRVTTSPRRFKDFGEETLRVTKEGREVNPGHSEAAS
jgi:tRNA(Ile)-lysidine synthase